MILITSITRKTKPLCSVLSKLLLVLFWLLENPGFAQTADYSFKDYLNDQQIRNEIQTYTSRKNLDSLQFYFSTYKDNLRYHKFLYKAILLNNESNGHWRQYLDTAFMLGLSFPCLQKELFKNYDAHYISRSFNKNYLKAFDTSLLMVLDSLRSEDQRFRLPLLAVKDKQSYDSLHLLQAKIDSSNIRFYKNLMATKGWPSYKKIGGLACAYAPPSPHIVIIHLGTKDREFQLQVINEAILLSEKQEEDWGNIIWLLSNLYYRPEDFTDFFLLRAENNKLIKDQSLYSLYCMSELLSKMSTKKILIQCKDERLYESVRKEMIEMNKCIQIPFVDEDTAKEMHIAVPKKLETACFAFHQNPSLSDNKVLFKFVNR